MIALIDADSMLYKAVYRCISFRELKDCIELLGKEEARQWMLSEVYERGLNRFEKQVLEIVEHLDSIMFQEVMQSEIFITTNKNCFRKKLTETYKAKRKKNNYVWMLRSHLMINDAKFSDVYEADDLIAERAKELGRENCIVVSPDKDLKQIGGYYFSYYKQKVKDLDGDVLEDEDGYPVTEFKQKEVEYITDEQADLLFWTQMLQGDTADNILGVRGIGKVKANKLLKDAKNRFIVVAKEYLKRSQREQFKSNYQLLKLGFRDD